MFSLDNFYNILRANFVADDTIGIRYLLKFNNDFRPEDLYVDQIAEPTTSILFCDQEPFSTRFMMQFGDFLITNQYHISKNKIFANSEHSLEKTQFLQTYNIADWYYFFHGFAALEWYRDYQYFPKVENQFTKVFISLNHLITKDRSYRLNLVANYIEQNILSQGIVSLPQSDVNGTVKTELFTADSLLSVPAKKLILKNILSLSDPLIADTEYPSGKMSAKLDIKLQQSAFWNVVSETVFYHNKLHLTEKTFKPIVARRPFILVAAPGNLDYLKSYGFKTFNYWIDESYDTIQDPDQRIQAITQELKKLCTLTSTELQRMYQEMQDVLDYNFNHFYGNFREIIVNELVDNFKNCTKHFDDFPLELIDLAAIKKRLLQ